MTRRKSILLVAAVGGLGVALVWGRDSLGAVLLALVAGALAWEAVCGMMRRPARAMTPRPDPEHTLALIALLVEMGDSLQEVSIRALTERGGWDRALFERVLARVERQTPDFQAALVHYFSQPAPVPAEHVSALLAVARLSTAYTYWTRLFPPQRQQETMFVLSLLQDLSEKVEHAIRLLDTGAQG